jgi:hypothetical protein
MQKLQLVAIFEVGQTLRSYFRRRSRLELFRAPGLRRSWPTVSDDLEKSSGGNF